MEGQAGAAGFRGGPGGPVPARRAPRAGQRASRPGCRGVLEGVHRRHRAGVPQADDRAAGHLDQAGLGGTDQRRAVLPGAAGRDRGAYPPGCDRRGQRDLLPRAADRRGPVRQDRLLQPAGDRRPGAAARVLRLPGRGPGSGGRSSGPNTTGCTAALWAEFSDWVTSAGRAAPAGPGIHPLRAGQPVRLSRSSPITGAPGRSARAGTGWIPRSGRPTSRSPCPGRWRPATGRSSTSRSARWARPTWP